MLKDASPFVKIIMLILMMSMFVFALWQLYRLYSIQKNGESSLATIEAYKEKVKNPQSITNKGTSYAPIFGFTTKSGKKITLTSGNFSDSKKYQIGQQVKVYYASDKPTKAILEGYFPYKIYIVLAVLCLIGSLLLFYYLKYPPTTKF